MGKRVQQHTKRVKRSLCGLFEVKTLNPTVLIPVVQNVKNQRIYKSECEYIEINGCLSRIQASLVTRVFLYTENGL